MEARNEVIQLKKQRVTMFTEKQVNILEQYFGIKSSMPRSLHKWSSQGHAHRDVCSIVIKK